MPALTAERTTGWARAHVAGPYRLYNLNTHKSAQVDNLADAHDTACERTCCQVLAADGTVVGWSSRDGVWHGAVA